MTARDITYDTLLSLPNVYRAFYGRFPSVLPVQHKAVKPVLAGSDVILQAATGAGKTEAVLAPCMERVIQSKRSEAVLYVQPTRALAFDLIRRFEPVMCGRLGLGMLIRTGDEKRSPGGAPDIMITTPESLDVALGSGNPDLKAFLLKVRTVIIDEVHPLVFTERGEQLAYLLTRLQHRIPKPLQRMALSATIADPDAVAACFGFRPDAVRIREDVSREIIPRLLHLKDEDRELPALLNDLHDEWGYRKILIFSNSRSRCDRLLGIVEGGGPFKGRTALHYSNLKPRERRMVEKRFRRHRRSVCIATSTLELGIDVGDVDAVILYEPPDTVSAFLQRVGRANRRQREIHFWGVCRGDNAPVQLLRFLAMLDLARQGKMEKPVPRHMPSVLCQQMLSFLYEKKSVSLPHVSSLVRAAPCRFSPSDVKPLMEFMSRRGWLRKTRLSGLFEGAWRYRDAFLEYRIWSNFPETEDIYTLEVSGESVADLPISIVRQLEPGDRVFLTGRRLKILMIHDAGPRKRVSAEPARDPETKEIAWIGPAGHVSFETAQAMKALIENPEKISDDSSSGLMTRTRRLYSAIRSLADKTARLHNGVELFVNAAGLYSYRTWLGSIGNWVLERCARHWLEITLGDEVFVNSDETGISASAPVVFEKLVLPVEKSEWIKWVRPNLKALQSAFPMNAYARALPKEMLLMEITDKIFDQRVADAFAGYLDSSSEIAHGALEALSAEKEADGENNEIQLLNSGQIVWDVESAQLPAKPDAILFDEKCHHARPLSGTLVGEFFRLKQCGRWINFQFLSPDYLSRIKKRTEDETLLRRMEEGKIFEADVLAFLKQGENPFFHISSKSEDGRMRSFKDRENETAARLHQAVAQIQSGKAESVWISQAVVSIPGSDDIRRVKGYIGIPDLIRLHADGSNIRLTVGDIKLAGSPRYHHQWQVAFYAWLIGKTINSGQWPEQILPASTGFLLNRSHESGALFARHDVGLTPFLSAMPVLLENLKQCLSVSPEQAAHQVAGHCIHCDFFAFCHDRLQAEEPVQFIPGLTPGDLLKLRQLNIRTLQEIAEPVNEQTESEKTESRAENIFQPQRLKQLKSRAISLLENRAFVAERHTRLFPANAETAVILYGIPDAVSGLPSAIGLQASGKKTSDRLIYCIGADESPPILWKRFSDEFREIWNTAASDRQGPQLFFFDQQMRQIFLDWAEIFGDEFLTYLLENRFDPYWTILSPVIHRHFHLPIPGRLTLYALNCFLGFGTELSAPESCFHPDEAPSFPRSSVGMHTDAPDYKRRMEATRGAGMRSHAERGNEGCDAEALQKWLTGRLILIEKIWKWLRPHLIAEQERESWIDARDDVTSPLHRYREFVEAEKSYREADKAALKRITFRERAARFRALGPLVYTGSLLNDEGRFLYRLTLPENAGSSKFRAGDFLLLTPETSSDIEDGYPVIVEEIQPNRGEVLLKGRRPRLSLMQGFRYTLEEDFSDWNTPKLHHVLNTVFSPKLPHPLADLLAGDWDFTQPEAHQRWLRNWLNGEGKKAGLNPAQQNAVALPFSYALGMVQGPPGTGKTHLLGWMLIALIRRAQAEGESLRIAVSALTHQAIDGVLKKVAGLVNAHGIENFPARCIKFGRWDGPEFDPENDAFQVESADRADDIFASPFVIVGATGYGFYSLFRSRDGHFPKKFDWVIFDEASQMLIPQALLSLIYGRGNTLFFGDVHQLPPVVQSVENGWETGGENAKESPPAHASLLSTLTHLYGASRTVRLNITYRMNDAICWFPSRMWYDNELTPDAETAQKRLRLNALPEQPLFRDILDPKKPVALVLLDHLTCHQESEPEAELLSTLAVQLMTVGGLPADELAVITPHRAQNNAILQKIGEKLNRSDDLPLVDTVERMQGAERDVILFGFTASNPDHLHGPFLNNPNRFNVAITRARKKLVVAGSRAFFFSLPQSEGALSASACFKAFYGECEKAGAVKTSPLLLPS